MTPSSSLTTPWIQRILHVCPMVLLLSLPIYFQDRFAHLVYTLRYGSPELAHGTVTPLMQDTALMLTVLWISLALNAIFLSEWLERKKIRLPWWPTGRKS